MWNKIKYYFTYLIAIVVGIFLFYLFREQFKNQDPKIKELKDNIKEKESKIVTIDNKIDKLDKQDIKYQEKIEELQKEKEKTEIEINKINQNLENMPNTQDITNITDAVQYVLDQLR